MLIIVIQESQMSKRLFIEFAFILCCITQRGQKSGSACVLCGWVSVAYVSVQLTRQRVLK